MASEEPNKTVSNTIIQNTHGQSLNSGGTTEPREFEFDSGLLFGLVALANGLITSESLAAAIEAWSVEPGRTLRSILVDRGNLDERTAAEVDALAAKHLESHHGSAWQSLIALTQLVRTCLDPGSIANPRLRAVISDLLREPTEPRIEPNQVRVGEPTSTGRRYRILRHHAQGGLGVVSLALDDELKREVALKEIQSKFSGSQDFRARFLREAQVTGRLEHPGIVPVHGIGFHDDGRPYYVMRFIRGETLKEAIARHHAPTSPGDPVDPARLSLRALIGRFVDACHAIAYAHSRNVLHRDIKPGNIMLGPFGETLVVDWGLAKVFGEPDTDPDSAPDEPLSPETGDGVTPTRTGVMLGTVGYMSPEQAEGKFAEMGPPSDVYSLGASLHCLVTGHPPFEGANKVDFFRRVIIGDFRKPREVNPSVPRPLEEICLKAMALRPQDRYPSAEALVDDLNLWLAGEPVPAYAEPWTTRLGRWSKRHKTILAAASVLLACLPIGLGVVVFRDQIQKVELAKQRDDANAARQLSDANRKLILASFKATFKELNSGDTAYLARSEKFRRTKADELVGYYRKLILTYPDDLDIRFDFAQAIHIAANIRRSIGDFASATLLYDEAVAILKEIRSRGLVTKESKQELVTILNDLGENLRFAGQPRKAEAKYREGLTLLGPTEPSTKRLPDEIRSEARLLMDLALALTETSRFDESKAVVDRSIALSTPMVEKEKSSPIDRMFLGLAYKERGFSLRLAGDFQGASTALAEASRLADRLAEVQPNPDTKFEVVSVATEQGLLAIDREGGDPAEALKLFDKAYPQLSFLYRAHPTIFWFHRELAVAMNGQARCHLAMAKYTAASKTAETSRQLLEQLANRWPEVYDYQSQLGRTLATLARIALTQGKVEDAKPLFDLAIRTHDRAIELNRESPEDRKLVAALRDEIERIKSGR